MMAIFLSCSGMLTWFYSGSTFYYDPAIHEKIETEHFTFYYKPDMHLASSMNTIAADSELNGYEC
jgi:hypothetical protein